MAGLVSICMIVKNEEEVLARALTNWRSLADELIIVDTGSTDTTIEIAKAHDAAVLHYDWQYPGNKGEARMVGIDAAQGDWIVVLDADEVIQTPVRLREIISQAGPNVDGINVKFANYEGDNVVLEWYQMRIFRRNHYRYIHREHEIPVLCSNQAGEQLYRDVTFEHRPPNNREPVKINPMLERLKLDVEAYPDDPHSLYMLARQYSLAGEYNKAMAHSEVYLKMPYDGLKSDVCRVAAISALNSNNRQAAYEWFHRATAYEPHRRLLWMDLAHLYYDDKQYLMALSLARMAADLPLSPYQRETQPHEQLVHICQLIESCRYSMAHEHSHN